MRQPGLAAKGKDSWTILVETFDGMTVKLSKGGKILEWNDKKVVSQTANHAEYEGIYRRLADVLDSGKSDVDGAPLQLVADAFLLGRRKVVAPFQDKDAKKRG